MKQPTTIHENHQVGADGADEIREVPKATTIEQTTPIVLVELKLVHTTIDFQN